MLGHIKSKARRGARRVQFSLLSAGCAAVGAGFGSASLYVALLQAGQGHAMAAFVLTCIWFGLSGVFLLLKGMVGDRMSDREDAPAATAPPVAHPNGHAATAPGVADAFLAGMSEGAGFARMQQRRGD
ncbi:hypothetical protein MHM88_16760 [Epibacterium sp. MM17-32]|uniref:hypothetical protein n=1 Tax=Epibacterium sp. MM17-32 TaxID=2917734 RepID=UPI001EF3E5EE|nr:hypothetical protein [Epibacterium sp. MM17-32]MCG7629463.1 hypothetical protein [Epibacterium sp. MM17-32]